jgi:hypothetical protein
VWASIGFIITAGFSIISGPRAGGMTRTALRDTFRTLRKRIRDSIGAVLPVITRQNQSNGIIIVIISLVPVRRGEEFRFKIAMIIHCTAFHQNTTLRAHITRGRAGSLLIVIIILNSISHRGNCTISLFRFFRITGVPDFNLLDIRSGPTSGVERILKINTIITTKREDDKDKENKKEKKKGFLLSRIAIAHQ